MTTTAELAIQQAPVSGAPGSWWRTALRSGWVPSGLVTAATGLVLKFYAVPLGTTAVFAAYLLLGVVLPGTLVWRAVHRGGGSFVADVAAGTALGYAGEVLAYIPARAVGLPLLVLAWPVGAIATFLALPRLRRYWRGAPDAERPPALWSWSIAGTVALLVFWSCKFFRLHGLHWPGYSTPDTDSPFHLALVGEAKQHLPMMIPWVSGEPLYYHWFVYADLAATSWVTGIEPELLLVRLSLLPMIAGFIVLIAILARKLFGHWWTGVAAVIGTLFVLAPSPYGWQLRPLSAYYAFSPLEDGSSLRLQLWTSPTQTFGALLFVPVILILVDLLRAERRPRTAQWGMFAVLACAVMGAKATYLPLLLAGLLLVVGVGLLVRRRPHYPAVIAAAITVACLLFAQFVLFGGTSQGLGWHPLATMQSADISVTTGFYLDTRPWRLALLLVLTGWCWVCMWSGVAGLLRQRRLLAPEILLLLGIGAAGIGAVVLLGQSGGSQGYFLQSARPYLALAAVGGLAALLGDRPVGRRRGAALAGATLAGTLVVKVVRMFDGTTTPSMTGSGGPKGVATALAWPYLASAGAVVLIGAAVWSTRRRMAVPRGMSLALIVCLLAGLGVATAYSNVSRMVRDSSAYGWRNVVVGNPVLTDGMPEAGRWLRDHSGPDDLVATNAHCPMGNVGTCTNLHFSVAAFTERRVLVEGWGFTTTAHVLADRQHTWVGFVPYWKPEVLAANDAAFNAPSAEALVLLRQRYRVRWLFADRTQPGYAPGLADFATLRYRSGDCAVYEL